MESNGRLNIFGATNCGGSSTLRKALSVEAPTHTDKNRPDSSSSSLFGENVLENFTLQTNFHRQQQRNKRKRKESSFSSCSSSSSASLLSLVPNSERTLAGADVVVAAERGAVSVGEENSFVGGGSAKEQNTWQTSEKLLKTADLNESSSCGSRAQGTNNNRSARQQDEPDSPQRKRPKYDYTRDQMFEIFQPWVIQTYGDRAKTKTITLKKQARIIKALKGLEMNNPDSSKFRFWVKTKGFTTSKPKDFQDIFVFQKQEENDGCLLYAPNTTETDTQPFKKVAVVENFFNIIYGVHVSLGSRSSRHAGQKRTYRTITETYAFLPREAVTKFLSLCGQCSKAMRSQSPGQLEQTVDIHPQPPATPKTDESFERDGKSREFCNQSSTPRLALTHSVTNVSASFDSLGDDQKYVKLMNYCEVSNNASDGSNLTYYQLLKTFYDNARKSTEGRKKVPPKEVVDLTGTPDSETASCLDSSNVPDSVFDESAVVCSERGIEKECDVGDVPEEDISLVEFPSKELFASEHSEVQEKVRLNNNLGDKLDASDSDSDSDSEAEQSESKPITSTYLELTRSMGVADVDALNMIGVNDGKGSLMVSCLYTQKLNPLTSNYVSLFRVQQQFNSLKPLSFSSRSYGVAKWVVVSSS
ncbi:uncharacterized protein LOC131679882 [Topomyia yanbarensis]|uniref:uncharacterized protein LOC131679882 n=1 Tax=Topomyia yanbarensis TaxID=2498891 RepID=UPI00273A812D|nr:uncharacterized protein LOC131679882 [Topomyia yanbarensis]